MNEGVNMKKNQKWTLAATVIIVVAAISRLLPHPDNVTPIASMALFGGAYFGRKYMMFLVPFAALLLSDIVLNNTILRGFYPDQTGFIFIAPYMIWGYLAFGIVVCLGYLLKNKVTVLNVMGITLISSLIFFFLTNYGFWLQFAPEKNMVTLGATFTAGVPFFRNTIIGNLFFSLLLFGGFEYFKSLQNSKKELA